jgi:hypothetical protein
MSATTTEPTTNGGPFVTRCRDGYDKNYPALRPVKRYGVWGAMALLMGYTARPKRIDIVCPACGAVFNSITDPAELAKFRYDEPRIGQR